ncbi:MAG: signal peptidase II [Clostridiales bacterium]|nr:signal peptidase II [Candidatus Cacconaster stercorequi]
MWIILLAAALLGADQYFKYLARRGKLPASLLGGRVQLTHLENDGLAGGRHRGERTLTTAVPCGAFAAALADLLPGLRKKSPAEKIGTAMILAGSISNLWDRLRRGSVTDYLRFPHLAGKKLRALVWNLADFLLLAGGILLMACNMIQFFRRKKRSRI